MGERRAKYDLIIEREAREELSDIAAFYRRRIVAAIRMLSSDAETETRNRKRLIMPLDLLVEATWECRIGLFRVLYGVEERTVRVLRVIMKKGTTEESL